MVLCRLFQVALPFPFSLLHGAALSPTGKVVIE